MLDAFELVGVGGLSSDNLDPNLFMTLTWRLGHVNEMLVLRADQLISSPIQT